MTSKSETDVDGARGGSDELADRVESFLVRNFPQIAIHGGSAAVESIDEAEGAVWLRLGGACSGCGISPMTIQAIQARMPQEIDGIAEVHVDAGVEATTPFPGRDEGGPPFPDAPF